VKSKYRKTAISSLRQVYTNASKVLVLDRGLAQVGDISLERKMQLLCSEWMTRLWTLQEGLLSSEVWVEFKDAIVPVRNVLDKVRSPPEDEGSVWDFLHDQSTGAETVNLIASASARHQFHILEIQQMMVRRQTTRMADEPVCLATLLNIDLANFQGMPSMEDIFRTLDRVPLALIFVGSPRLTTAGLRWAPASFLGRHAPGVYSAGEGTLTQRGLQGTFASITLNDDFEFQYSRETLADNFAVKLQDNGLTYTWAHSKEYDNGWHQLRQRKITKPALIFSYADFVAQGWTPTALVSDVQEEEGVLFCHYEMLGQLFTEFRWNAAWGDHNLTTGSIPRDLTGTSDAGKVWCVD
jgi:hypothetical protein